jgi:hypothetical protein
MKNSESPAMPVDNDVVSEMPDFCVTQAAGLTKREMIAMNIMASISKGGAVSEIGNEKHFAERACSLTDALLKELEK